MRGDQGSGPYAPGRSPAAVRFAHPLPTGNRSSSSRMTR